LPDLTKITQYRKSPNKADLSPLSDFDFDQIELDRVIYDMVVDSEFSLSNDSDDRDFGDKSMPEINTS